MSPKHSFLLLLPYFIERKLSCATRYYLSNGDNFLFVFRFCLQPKQRSVVVRLQSCVLRLCAPAHQVVVVSGCHSLCHTTERARQSRVNQSEINYGTVPLKKKGGKWGNLRAIIKSNLQVCLCIN